MSVLFFSLKVSAIGNIFIKPLMPGGNKKVTHIYVLIVINFCFGGSEKIVVLILLKFQFHVHTKVGILACDTS